MQYLIELVWDKDGFLSTYFNVNYPIYSNIINPKRGNKRMANERGG